MTTIFQTDNITIKVQLSNHNSFDSIFGRLNFELKNERISDNEEHNLSFFYVDCDILETFLTKNDSIENDLFQLDDSHLIEYWKRWKNFTENVDLIKNETPEVEFFNDNFFKNGVIFRSSFFNHIFIFFVLKNSIIRFVIWSEKDLKVIRIDISKEELIKALNSFKNFFEQENLSMKIN
nr:hypothetical protein [uncultured Fluviicola sp.]